MGKMLSSQWQNNFINFDTPLTTKSYCGEKTVN
jgi:hypothetical protein